MPAQQVESVVLGVAAGSRVTSFDVATTEGKSEFQMCVEEVAADGTVGSTLIEWNHYGTRWGCPQAGLLQFSPPRHYRGGDDGDALQGLRPSHLQLQQRRRRHLPRHGRRPVGT